ncbi:hypothetical protein PTTG_25642 [Puccinia triticina 1-1 BBBD Race 1]|uniref:Secreted protein n=2 Tax=Puccinia triticina TaxID=208348 RepID=A0A180H1M1_PUCT1|nr:uncharacterized protein PtA15_9A413 [Puccinia triticina]OAV98382.1 hypothetical protein PTTG_25642 [Puccinia triticina 1-1 BBBD Race 1]WAQ88286.1 hypothetical protein PtA15_9A413 [Puccinia triticina]WAR60459.1 hypothetical protein PtB15_9B398 [Puccinia triticina]
MFSPSLVRLSLLALIGQLVLATPNDDPEERTQSCFYYSGANTTQASCNENPHVVCKKGCTGYVTAEGCQPTGNPSTQPTDAPSTQYCEIGFGRDSAVSKVCQTKTQTYLCSGKTTGAAQCHGCVQS